MRVREVVTSALRKIGVVAMDEAPTAEQMDNAAAEMGRMIKAWANRYPEVWTQATLSVTLTTAASYALDVRPFRINNARLRRDGIDTPMQPMTRGEYDSLPVKTTTGLPTTFFYDRGKDAGTLYVWPVLAAAGGETVEITYNREIGDYTNLNSVADIPEEWEQATIYNLAARLSPDYEVASDKVDAMAVLFLEEALAADREGSAFWYDPCD